MSISRRQFIQGGVSAFTFSFAAPAFLNDIARAQGARARNLVVVYSERRQRLAEHGRPLPGSLLLQPASDDCRARRSSAADRDRLERQGAGSSPAPGRASSHFQRGTSGRRAAHGLSQFQPIALPGARHLGHGQSRSSDRRRAGWGAISKRCRPIRSPGGVRRRNCQGPCSRATSACPRSRTPPPTRSAARTPAAEAANERASATRIASHLPDERPNLAFVNTSAQAAFATLDRVGSVISYTGTVTYPNNGFAQALRTVAGAIVRNVGTRVFWVQTGGFDTHAQQGARRRRQLRQPDGQLRRRRGGLLQRPAQPGRAERHADHPVLGIRTPHIRERQPGHRPRRRRQ